LKSISWAQAQELQYQLLKNSGVKNGPSATRQTIQMKNSEAAISLEDSTVKFQN